MWDAVIRFLRFLDKIWHGLGHARLGVRAMVLVVAAVLVWLFLTGQL